MIATCEYPDSSCAASVGGAMYSRVRWGTRLRDEGQLLFDAGEQVELRGPVLAEAEVTRGHRTSAFQHEQGKNSSTFIIVPHAQSGSCGASSMIR
jgi:hypothetical protein